jgi:hypothetical protein
LRKRANGRHDHQKRPKSAREARGRLDPAPLWGNDRRGASARLSPIDGSGDSAFAWRARGATHANGLTMTDGKNKDEGRPGHLAKKDARRDRLKDALRENLKRRKTQARGRNDIAPASSHGGAAAPHDGGGEKPGE